MPFQKTHFWSSDLSDWLKCHPSTFRKISQGYCTHLPNMKRIRLMVAKLLRKENADPVESFLPYTNKRPVTLNYLYEIINYHIFLNVNKY